MSQTASDLATIRGLMKRNGKNLNDAGREFIWCAVMEEKMSQVETARLIDIHASAVAQNLKLMRMTRKVAA